MAAAVNKARKVCSSVLQLNKQLRGSDTLAEQVKQLKQRIKSLEIAMESILR